MFGYVTPLKPELKIKEFDMFKAYYCGLCHEIKNLYGNIPRMSLNYDMTFLGLLLDSLSLNPKKINSVRCIVHPNKRKPIVCESDGLKYAASMNVILFYHKLLDDVTDDKSFKSKLGTMLLLPSQKKLSDDFKLIDSNVQKKLKDLQNLETNLSFSSLDEISHPFADLTGIILKSYPSTLKDDSLDLRENLYWLGYNLGKWIYLIDALDDLEEDIKKNKFNPLIVLFNKESLDYSELFNTVKSRMEFLLLNCSCSCLDFFLKLNINNNNNLLRNILEFGIMDKNDKVLNKCIGSKCKKV